MLVGSAQRAAASTVNAYMMADIDSANAEKSRLKSRHVTPKKEPRHSLHKHHPDVNVTD